MSLKSAEMSTEIGDNVACESDGIYFTPYRVSTITCNANIGDNINLNLKKVFQHLNIEDKRNSFVWIQYLKEEEENFRGVYPKKKKKRKTEGKNRFDNQITVIYKYDATYMPNIKIFKNGNIQLTGIKDVSHTEKIINAVIENIKRIYTDIDREVFVDSDEDYLSKLMYKNFKIRMINTDFKIYHNETMEDKFNIKRKDLHNILISDKYNNKSSFQPGIYQGVKLEYYWNTMNEVKNGICSCTANCFGKSSGTGDGKCKKVTIAIFESGSVLITGAITFAQVDEAYSFIRSVIIQNRKDIQKKLTSDLLMLY